MANWYREVLVSLSVAARVVAIFAVAVVFGVLVSLKIGNGNLWIAATAAASLLLFVVLPIRLWWLRKRAREL
jgi:hypothetical protein